MYSKRKMPMIGVSEEELKRDREIFLKNHKRKSLS